MGVQMKLHRGFCIICNKFLPFKEEHWHPRGTLASAATVHINNDNRFDVSFVSHRIICKNTLIVTDKRSQVSKFLDDLKGWLLDKVEEFEGGD